MTGQSGGLIPPHRGAEAIATLFATALFISAFLLFTLEPMVAKTVLPTLGGTPMVWNTCMVFFQATLLAGYLLAHASVRAHVRDLAMWVHPALLLASMLLLPIVFLRVPTATQQPAVWLLIELVRVAGLPVLALSMTAPVLQVWFARTQLPSSQDPYFLYAASNAGSLIALLAYPTLVEPRLGLQPQARLWAMGFVLLAVTVCVCAFVARRSEAAQVPASTTGEGTPIDGMTRLRWVALAFVPSSLMLGVTTYFTTDVAAVPLLWVVPLALYLATFVLAFGRRASAATSVAERVLPPIAVVAAVLVPARILPIQVSIPFHLLLFTAVAMMCHGRLSAERPPVKRLTEFYVLLSLGGVAGGIFNTLLAPLLFTSATEYPLMVVCACAVRALHVRRPTKAELARDLAAAAAAGLAMAATVGLRSLNPVYQFVAVGMVAGGILSQSRQPVRFAMMIAALLSAATLALPGYGKVLYAERTFFGSYHVSDDADGRFRRLYHGTTLHGMESLEFERRSEPLSYYHHAGPFGQAYERIARIREATDVAVVGLGVGSLAAYARDFQHWTFYEIDPAVERIAADPRLFGYLEACSKRCDVVLGDARLSLARTDARYDAIVLDAFSSDAIPMHLMTREAFALYLDRLKPNGVLAIHVSNRFLQLNNIVGRLAADRGLTTYEQMRTVTADASSTATGEASAHWVITSADPSANVALATDPRWTLLNPPAETPLWTDDFSNILVVLKLGRAL